MPAQSKILAVPMMRASIIWIERDGLLVFRLRQDIVAIVVFGGQRQRGVGLGAVRTQVHRPRCRRLRIRDGFRDRHLPPTIKEQPTVAESGPGQAVLWIELDGAAE